MPEHALGWRRSSGRPSAGSWQNRDPSGCGLPLPPAPVPFCKFSNALAAHGEAVKLPPDYKEYDYEAELVVVMGRPARDVSVDEALDYVYGYTCGDDRPPTLWEFHIVTIFGNRYNRTVKA